MTERDELAREAVLLQLGLAHDRMVVSERLHRKRQEHDAAEGAHRVSVWLLKAYAAERDNPPIVVGKPPPGWAA